MSHDERKQGKGSGEPVEPAGSDAGASLSAGGRAGDTIPTPVGTSVPPADTPAGGAGQEPGGAEPPLEHRKRRLFLAVNLSLATTRRIGEVIERMRRGASEAGVKVAWVPVANLHVTLKFLGWTNPEVAVAIRDRLAAVCRGRPVVEVAARGVGAFPSENGARVLWVGVDDLGGGLGALAAVVERAMVELGFAREERAFRPHVTIGRVKSERARVGDLFAPHRALDCGNSLVREVVLYESTVTSRGSEYTALGRVPLDAPPYRAERQTREVEGDPPE